MSENTARVQALYDRLNRRDATMMAELLHEDLKDHTSHGETDGRAAHEQHVLASIEGFPDLRFEVSDLFGDGDKVVARGRLSGTNKGPFMGAPPSGKAFSIAWIAIYHFRGDKVAERWLQGDDFGMMVQLGFVAPPGLPR